MLSCEYSITHDLMHAKHLVILHGVTATYYSNQKYWKEELCQALPGVFTIIMMFPSNPQLRSPQKPFPPEPALETGELSPQSTSPPPQRGLGAVPLTLAA